MGKYSEQSRPTAEVEIYENSNLPACFSRGFIDEIRQIGIRGINSTINQIPSPTNGHAAIVTSAVVTEYGSFSGIGAATPEAVNGSTHPQDLLDRAWQESLLRSAGMASTSLPCAQKVIDVPTSLPPSKAAVPAQQRMNGGGGKPASEKQMNLINTLCVKQFVSPEEMASTLCNKPLEQLTGADANKIIQTMNVK